VEDLNVRAQQGLLSPDDYLITEEEFTKGQMNYKRASDLLHRDCFTQRLSVPEITIAQKTIQQNVESKPEVYETGQAKDSYKTGKISKPNFEESVSPFSEWLSQINFANAATSCVIILAAVWFFDANNNKSQLERQPADVTSSGALQKKNVEREIIKQDYRKAPTIENTRVEKLMPSERPRSASAGAPALAPAQRPYDSSIEEPALSDELRSPNRGQARVPVREVQNGEDYLPPEKSYDAGGDRDLASDGSTQGILSDDEGGFDTSDEDIENRIRDSQLMNGEEGDYGNEPLIDPMGEAPEEAFENDNY
jgi:hypothetical protein